MRPIWIVLGIIMAISGLAIGYEYYDDTWLVLFPAGALISVGGMTILLGATLKEKAKPLTTEQQQASAMYRARQKQGEKTAATPPTTPSSPASSDPTEQLKKLGEMHDSGILSDEEFTAAKKNILEK